ncbi:MAG TPA: hypothetical protein VG308_11905, partial [Stellaceae bacterium]|nr:hypothetical protein [Stellaceae bacterium]
PARQRDPRNARPWRQRLLRRLTQSEVQSVIRSPAAAAAFTADLQRGACVKVEFGLEHMVLASRVLTCFSANYQADNLAVSLIH